MTPAQKPHYPKQIKHLGDQLRAKRLDLGLLQKEVAEIIGVTALTVVNWELGHTEPAGRHRPGLSRFLGHSAAREEVGQDVWWVPYVQPD